MEPHGIALVTGASRGLGRAIALELARRGFEVVAAMRAPDPEAFGDAPRLRIARLDVTYPETIEIPDGVRVVVNNAGLDSSYEPVEHQALDAWRALFETNLFGLVEVVRRAVPKLVASGGGVLCNVTSASLCFPMPFYAAYRASKAAVSALGESLRAELAPLGVRVLEVLPGPIDTDMLTASDRPPEALAHARYRDLAQRAWDGRRGVAGQVTAPEVAARAIAAAILDDASPLRVACDPLGAGLLAGWRASEDEAWLRAMLASLGLPVPQP